MRFAWQTILRLGKVNSFTLLSLLRIVDFAGEESACGFLAAIGKIGHCEVLLELVHKFEIKIKQIGCEAVNCLYRNFKLMRQSLKQGVEKESHGKRGVLAVAVGEVADIVLKMFISSRV